MDNSEFIGSPQNPLVKEIRRSVHRGALTRDGFAVAETFHLLEEALRSGCEVGAVVVAESAWAGVEQYAGRLRRVRLARTPDKLFGEIAATETSQGVIVLVRPPSWTIDRFFRGCALVVVLDAVQDPGNAGTIVRSAEAFGATGVAFLKGSVCPWNPKTVRASAGSLFRVPVVTGIERPQMIETCRQNNVTLYAATAKSRSAASSTELTAPVAFVIGNEGRGLHREWTGQAREICIPTRGVESLNAAIAAGILLYEASRQRGA
jgi:RNA methyltransferase, TrmH family